MKRILCLVLAVIFLTGCESEENSITDKSGKNNNFKVSSVSHPMTFKENEIELAENISVDDVLLSKDGTYIITTEFKPDRTVELKSGSFINNEFTPINAALKSSYIYDICSSEDYIYCCYSFENDNIISVYKKDTGELVNSKKLDIYSSYFEIEYDKGNFVLIYRKTDDNENFNYPVNIYDDKLNLVCENFDISQKVGMSDCIIVSLSGSDECINALCMSNETKKIGILKFSYTNDYFDFSKLDFDMCSSFEPVSLYSTDDNSLIFQYCDRETNMTYINIYDSEVKETIDMFDFNGCDKSIRPAEDDYIFYLSENDLIYGYKSSSAKPDVISDETDYWTLISSFYDCFDNKIIMYRQAETNKTSVLSINQDSYNSILEYDSKELKKIHISENGDICTLINDEDGYHIQICNEYGKEKNQYDLTVSGGSEITNLALDKSGNLFFIVNNSEFQLIECDANGNETNRTIMENIISVYDMYADISGNINIYANTYDGNQIISYKSGVFVKKTLNEYMTFNYLELCGSCEDDNIFFRDINGIYSYSLDTADIKKVFNMNGQMLSCSADKCAVRDENTFIFAGRDYVSGKEAVCISSRDDSLKTEKEIINIAEIGTQNNDLRILFRKYNKKTDDYTIKISNYKDQNVFSEAVGRGYTPDIITYAYDSGFNFKRYVSKGYAEKLDDYISNDPDINADDYYWNLFKLSNNSDAVYQIASSAEFQVIESADNSKMNMEYLLNTSKKYGIHTFYPVSYTTNYNMILNDIAGNYIESNINYDDNSFNGNSGIISELFTLAGLYYNNKDEVTDETNQEDYKLRIFSIYDFSHSYNTENLYPFPLSEDSYQVSISDKMIIPVNSKNKAESWRIIKAILLDDYQNEIADGDKGFPVKKSAFTKKAELRREHEAKNSESVLEDKYIDFIDNILKNAVTYAMPDARISKFINESFQEYTTGNVSSEEVAVKLINAVKRFLQEN